MWCAPAVMLNQGKLYSLSFLFYFLTEVSFMNCLKPTTMFSWELYQLATAGRKHTVTLNKLWILAGLTSVGNIWDNVSAQLNKIYNM